MTNAPLIKWSGSKRSQSSAICRVIPDGCDTYYEPFCGSAAVLHHLLVHFPKKFKRYICSDLNSDLVAVFNLCKDNPDSLSDGYERLWSQFVSIADIENRKEFYNAARERLNRSHAPVDFLWIMRTCMNGMPRYNRNGDFNTSLHFTRKGIAPDAMRKIIFHWSDLLNRADVLFRCCAYNECKPSQQDFVYLDPPYAGTRGMYFGRIDQKPLLEYVKNLPCRLALSYDGYAEGETLRSVDILEGFHRVLIASGNSSFRRIRAKKTVMVYESLYCNYKEPEF